MSKKSTVKKVLLGLAVVVLLFVVVVALQPSEYRIERSTKMSAPAADVFAQVNDFHKWQAWSPWAKLDPEAKNSFEGPPSGKGAIFKWSGNSEVGEGAMTMTESQPNELIKINLEFLRPFKDTSTAEFAFKPDGDQTAVTWSMYGRRNFIGKGICLFMSMDKMVGGEFEKGLAQIKSIVEAEQK